MKRVLLTGMSGTGKSTLIRALAERGYRAVDADSDEWSHWVPVDGDADPFASASDQDSVWRDQDWVWREDRIHRLLVTDDADVLFVSGTASNQGKFHAQFDHIVLLSARRACSSSGCPPGRPIPMAGARTSSLGSSSTSRPSSRC